MLLLLFVGYRVVMWRVHEGAFQAARAALVDGQFEVAEGHLSRCRWAAPRHGDTLLLSAQVARRSRNYDRAQQFREEAAAVGARRRSVELEAVLASAQQGLTPAVEDQLRQHLKSSRTDFPLVAEVLTGEYMRLYRLGEAAEVLNRWVELEPEAVEPWLRRGWVHERTLNFDLALGDYRRALELDSTRLPLRQQIAEILFKLRRLDQATVELNLLLELQPKNVQAAVLLAKCYRELGQLDAAAAVLGRVPRSDQEDARYQAEWGLIALANNDLETAQGALTSALARLPREREILYGLQQTYSRLGKKSEASRIDAVLKQVDADGRRMGEVITLLSSDPLNAPLRFEGAMIFLRNGVAEDGVRWLQMAIDADPDFAPAHAVLADYYQQHENPALAALHRSSLQRIEKQTSRQASGAATP